MQRVKSALFLDFDNVFGGLHEFDRRAAYAMGEDPHRWLEALSEYSLPRDADRRDILVRRAYLNPVGRVQDSTGGNDKGWLYLSRYRPNLIQAGFEVIDCPTLTAGLKNAADIRMVIDILAARDADVRYDEFIIASGDADLTPLLQVLRANDRRTTVMSAGPTAPAFRNVADVHFDMSGLMEPRVGEAPHHGGGTESDSMASDTHWAEERQRVVQAATGHVDENDGPMLLSELGLKLRSDFDSIVQTDWFGTGSLSTLLAASEPTAHFRTKGHYVWNPEVHDEPDDEIAHPVRIVVPDSIERICRITDLPRLDMASWEATFDALARYAATHEFNLTECTAWCRDYLSNKGVRVGRMSIGFIVHAARYGGVWLNSTPPPDADDIREGLISNIMNVVEEAGLQLTDDELDDLRDWLEGREFAS